MREVLVVAVCVVGFLLNQLSNKKPFKLLYIFKHAPKNYFVLFIWEFRYIDDVLSLYNSNFNDFTGGIYSTELEKRRPQIQLDLHMESDNEGR